MSDFAQTATDIPPRKRKLSFPTAYTVLLIVAALVAMLTWLVPAGTYDKLSYANNTFTVAYTNGDSKVFPATQETLNELGIKAELEKFTNGDIYKPVSIPNSYSEVTANPQGVGDFFQAPIKGMYGSIDVVFFVLVLGGFIGIVHHCGAFTAGIQGLSHAFQGREQWLIIIVTGLIALGGTSFGLAEETIALSLSFSPPDTTPSSPWQRFSWVPALAPCAPRSIHSAPLLPQTLRALTGQPA